jgi:nucleotide-binding universal stress UspA family protein
VDDAERTIIVGYDPEHGGEDAVRLSGQLAAALEARELVVTSLPWPGYLAAPSDLQAMADAEMEPRYTALRDSRGEGAGLTGRAVPGGSAALTLLTAAEDEEAALIVIGSSHRGPVGRTLLGSVGESLLHGAPCAVAVAPRGYAEREEGLLRLCVAVDGSPEAAAALETTIQLARRLNAELTILTVADYPRYGYSTAWSVLAAGEIVDADRKHKEQVIREARERVPEELPVKTQILTGDAGRLLGEASEGFDLLVLGSRGYGGLQRTLLGSTSRKVIHAASCPVLVLPRGAGEDPLGVCAG